MKLQHICYLRPYIASSLTSDTHELECDMVKYFTNGLNSFSARGRVKIKPESEISSHIQGRI